MTVLHDRVMELFEAHRVIGDNFVRWQDELAREKAGFLSKHDVSAILYLGDVHQSTMSELALKTNLSVSSATVVVDRLESHGLAVRRRSDHDRRVVRVSLTKEGERFLHLIKETAFSTIRTILETLDSKEQELLLALTKKIVTTLAKQTT
jgi:DNA-binding MarR family transcriptional regulator